MGIYTYRILCGVCA